MNAQLTPRDLSLALLVILVWFEIDSVCFSFRIVKIWIYSHLAADFPLMDGYSEAVAGLFTICL